MKNIRKKIGLSTIFFIVFLFAFFSFNITDLNAGDGWTMPDYTWEVEDSGKIIDTVDPSIDKPLTQKEIENLTKSKDLNPLGNLQVKIPGIDELAKKYPLDCSEDKDGQKTCKVPWIAIYITAIYNYLLGIGGILSVIALMIGGVIWLVSAGNASRISEAKSWITGSITGIVILLTSYVLLHQINPNLVGLRYLKLESINPILNEASEAVAAGRLDSDCILQTYGRTESEVRAQLVTINFLGKNLQVHSKAKDAFEAVNKEIISKTNYRTAPNGTFNWRYVSGRTNILSLHSFGIAIDLEPVKNNDYYPKKCRNGRCTYAISGKSYSCSPNEWCSPNPPTPWKKNEEPNCMTDIPSEVVEIFKKHGFDWGGDWKSYCDAMHFEWHGLCKK